jgi:acetyl-CoA synthetase
VPVLAHRMRKFEPEQAFRLMARHRVRNVFMPPTALTRAVRFKVGKRLRNAAVGSKRKGVGKGKK